MIVPCNCGAFQPEEKDLHYKQLCSDSRHLLAYSSIAPLLHPVSPQTPAKTKMHPVHKNTRLDDEIITTLKNYQVLDHLSHNEDKVTYTLNPKHKKKLLSHCDRK